MSREDESEKKCFTYIWKLENVSYCWQKKGEFVESPPFIFDELGKTKWILTFRVRNGKAEDMIGLLLERQKHGEYTENVDICCELAFLSTDSTVLESFKERKIVTKNGYCGSPNFVPRKEFFIRRRSAFLPQNTLTARCRVWESVGEIWKNVQVLARTRIVVEKRSLMWNIENFSTLESDKKRTYEIKSLETSEQLMCLELFVTGEQILDEMVRFAITPNYQIIKTCCFQLFFVDISENLEECFHNEFWFRDQHERKEFPLTKRKLIENKSAYLPDDALSLKCEFSYTAGVKLQETHIITGIESSEQIDLRLQKENELQVPSCILIDSLKSMLNNSSLSDVKLKTRCKVYPAHTAILGARSPVFKAMFSNDMKEKMKDSVDIDDLSDETLLRMLRYIYSAEVGELNWDGATALYEAADKYEVLNLKDLCSSYLKTNLCPNNACEALVLADLHQDRDLLRFVQDFILRHGKNIINSEEWEKLMETNIKLAATTLCVKYKE